MVNLGEGSLLIDPQTLTGTPVEGMVLAVHEDNIARVHCETDVTCGVRIGSFGDRGHGVQLPDYLTPERAEFSPDGRTLAVHMFPPGGVPVGVEVSSQSGGSELLALVDVATGEVTATIPTPTTVTWAPTGEWAFVGRGSAVHAVHRSGSPNLEIPVAGFPQHIVVLPSSSQ